MSEYGHFYSPGDTVSRYYYFRDKNNQLFDPDTATSKVYDPEKTQVATPTLTKVSVGKYEFNYTLPGDATKGYWTVVVTAAKGGTQNTEKYTFPVLAVP